MATAKELFEGDVDALVTSFPPDPNSVSGEPFNHSSADFALLVHLAGLTGCNAEQMRRVFCESELGQRDKWTGSPYYQTHSIEKAIAAYRERNDPAVMFGAPGPNPLPIVDPFAAAQQIVAATQRETELFGRAWQNVADFQEFEAAPMEWICENLMPRELVGSLVATGGTGKGHFLMYVCQRLSLGLPVLGFRTPKRQTVLHISLEDDLKEAHRRFKAAAALLPPGALTSGAPISETFGYVSLRGFGRADLSRLRDQILRISDAKGGLDLVDIDPLTKTLREGTDINNQADISGLIAIMEEISAGTGAGVLFAHHTNKQALRDGTQLLGGSSTGSLQFEDQSRYVMGLRSLLPEDLINWGLTDERSYVQFQMTKGNYVPTNHDAIIMDRRQGGALQHIQVAAPADALDEIMFSILPDPPGQLDTRAWDDRAQEEGISRRKSTDARGRLVKSGRVKVDRTGSGLRLYRRLEETWN